jgi:NADH dehydrogenase/NADH:ubiquinone oxidoreductase subunit G
MKAVCAIVFVLSSFTIPAQAQNCSGTIIEPSTMSAQTIAHIVVTEPTVEAADEVMVIGPNATKETPVEAIEPSDATQVAEHATRGDSKLMDEATAPSTTPAQIVVNEPTIEATDHVMIVGPNATKETAVEAIEPSDATQVAEQATRTDSKLMDEAIAPSTTPAQIVVSEPTAEELSPADHVTIIDPNAAKETSVEAVEPHDATQLPSTPPGVTAR